MSLLNNLEKEAQASRDRRARARAANEAQSQLETARIKPVLEQAHEFFVELRTLLNDMDRKVECDVLIPGVGELRGLVQQNYRVWTEVEGELPPVGFRFDCIGQAKLEARIDSEARLAGLERTLRDAGLKCRRRPEGGGRYLLSVEPQVPVSLTLSADMEQGSVRMAARNLFNLGVQAYRFKPEQVDTPLLEALAKCVVREPNRFAELSGNAVDQASRAALQKRLGREKRRRDAELGGLFRRALFPITEGFRRLFLGQ